MTFDTQKIERGAFFITIIGLVVLLLLAKNCHRTPVDPDGEIIEHRVVTTYVPGVADTTFFRVAVPYRVPVYYDSIRYRDSVRIIDHIVTNTRMYDLPVNDSLISGNIYTELSLDSCKIIYQHLDYTPKFPKYITRVDTVKIKETIIKEKARNQFFIGFEVGGNANTFSAGPKLSLATKKKMLYSYRYGLVDKTHNVGVSIKIGK